MSKDVLHTTNYENAFIVVAEDCKAQEGVVPPLRGDKKTVASLEYGLVFENPYKYTSDEVKFEVYCQRNGISKSARTAAYQDFFSKGQPCFRASPLTKTYGWGVHFNPAGKMALVGAESDQYQK